LYVEWDNGERELYDLTRDPYEMDNLAARAPRARLIELRERLHALATCAGPTCRSIEDLPAS
jgi:hypothetical protein